MKKSENYIQFESRNRKLVKIIRIDLFRTINYRHITHTIHTDESAFFLSPKPGGVLAKKVPIL